jgi:hypothetical protein
MLLHQSCEKVANKYLCEICDYTTSRKSSYVKHLLTSKHTNTTYNYNYTTTLQLKVAQKNICNCGKEYKHRSSLWNHKKICINKVDTSVIDHPITTELIDESYEEDEQLNNNYRIIETKSRIQRAYDRTE